MPRSIVVGALAALVVLPAAAHAGPGPSVTMGPGFVYSPNPLLITAGETVRFVNDEDPMSGVPHSATSFEGVFDSGQVPPNDSTPADTSPDPGRYEFYCTVHGASQMNGRLDVSETNIADPPELDARPGVGNLSAASYVIGAPASEVSSGLTLTDNGQIASGEVKITTGFDPAGDELQFTNQNGITGTYDSGTGVLTLTGATTDGAYESALQSVRFRTSAGTGTRRVVFEVTDNAGAVSPPDFRNVNATVQQQPQQQGGGGGGGGAPPPPQQAPPLPGPLPNQLPRLQPAPRLQSVNTFTVDRRGRVRISFRTNPAIAGSFRLLAPAGARAAQRRAPRVYARASFASSGRRGIVTRRVTLSRFARAALRRSRTGRIRARLVLTQAGHLAATKTITLRR
jgi:plastocyanin